MRYYQVILFLFLSILFTSCSWIHQLIIRNDLDETVEIIYTIKESEYNMITKKIKVYENSNLNKSMTKDDFKDVKHYFNFDKNIMKVWLPSNHTLVLGSFNNTKFRFYSQTDYFNLGNIEIKSSKGIEKIPIKNLEKYFSKNNRFKAIINVN